MTEGWDCHAHVFGPYDRFPLAAERSYTPPEATLDMHTAMLERLGLSHGVLVHPSAYGEDHSALLDALAERPHLRGIVVATKDTHLDLKKLRAKGVRAARFSHRAGAAANFAGSASFDDLVALAPRLADAGLHAELWTDCKALPDIAATLRALPFPVVIDHMGMFEVNAGLNDPGFRCLLSLVSEGKAWVKLCVYRNLTGVADFESGRQFHDALVSANPDRLIWGTDWPHLRVTPEPDAADLLATFIRWNKSEALTRKLLVENPQRLYG